jgi:uncharacterized membrane protein YeiH
MKQNRDKVAIKVWMIWHILNIVLVSCGLLIFAIEGIDKLAKYTSMIPVANIALNVISILASIGIIVGILNKNIIVLYSSYLYLLIVIINSLYSIFNVMNSYSIITCIITAIFVYEMHRLKSLGYYKK